MSFLGQRDLGWILWHHTLAKALVADLRSLAPTEEIDHELAKLDPLLADLTAEIERRRDLTTDIAHAVKAVR